MLTIRFFPSILLFVFSAGPMAWEGAEEAAFQVVPVTEEPLHIVRFRSDRFLIYTNWIEPGIWTQYHEHRNDLLAVIVADTVATSQAPAGQPREQSALAGTLVLFPYSDDNKPFVHRVSASGSNTFINVGLEFIHPLANACHANTAIWDEPLTRSVESNRRGRGYHLTLPPAAMVELPQNGSGLLLAPMDDANLELDLDAWRAAIGGLRFFDGAWPKQIKNVGTSEARLVVFQAC